MNGNTRTVQRFGDTVGTLLLKMLPFALGTISPTMIGLVVIFLTGTRGLVKTCAFILGKYLFYVLWGLISLDLADQISSPSLTGFSIELEAFFLVAGLLLLILAVRNFFGEDDPDTPPPKFMTILAKLGPIKLFGCFNHCRSQTTTRRKHHLYLIPCPAHGLGNAHPPGRVSRHG